MQGRTWRALWLGALVSLPLAALAAGDGEQQAEVDDGLDVYFRDADLDSLAEQELAMYPESEPGESSRFERAFADAPPQIPHTVEDMYPITAEDNECLECHHPENAIEKEDIPVSESHFQRAVMAKGPPGQPMAWVVQRYEKAGDVVGSRYNCSVCHAPQSTNARVLPSRFVAEAEAK
jgi:cytochrome c-type protein NapB